LLRDVLVGEEGQPGNYWLSIIKVKDRYDAPPHKHNFDQVRIMLQGKFNFGSQDQEEGTVGYFCEGTTYTQSARGESVTLLLQCEGASGARYASQGELRAGVHALKQAGGDFAAGRYIGPDPISGAQVEKDSYEAIWEQIADQRLTYQPARYGAPVIMDPAAFVYRPVPGQEALLEKHLGEFNERKTKLSLWKLEPGGRVEYSSPARTLLFIKSGRLEIDGEEVGEKFAVEIAPDELVELCEATYDVEIMVLRLPQ
jgi:hypothetical protein